MRTLAIILSCLLLSATSFAMDDGEEKQYWICHQAGNKGKFIAVAMSEIFESSSNDYYEKQDAFEKEVKQQHPNFDAEFSSRCEDYSSLDRAKRYQQRRVEKYEKSGYKLLWVNFSYGSEK